MPLGKYKHKCYESGLGTYVITSTWSIKVVTYVKPLQNRDDRINVCL